jgi:hypothetical protein
MVREAIRGMESSRMMERARHQTILPFTRYLAGPADYTTMLFSERRRDSNVPHQIATMVVYSSPLLTIAAHPQSILDYPAAGVIKSIPAIWDETIVLPDSKIGECVVFARRTGDTWFLAIMNALTPRRLRIPLSFLGPGRYQTTSATTRRTALAQRLSRRKHGGRFHINRSGERWRFCWPILKEIGGGHPKCSRGPRHRNEVAPESGIPNESNDLSRPASLDAECRHGTCRRRITRI